MKALKYLPLAAMGKDIHVAYKEETGQGRPFYLSRRFLGAVITLISGFLAIQFGIEINADTLATLTDSAEKMITAAFLVYGIVLAILGQVKKEKKEDPK